MRCERCDASAGRASLFVGVARVGVAGRRNDGNASAGADDFDEAFPLGARGGGAAFAGGAGFGGGTGDGGFVS